MPIANIHLHYHIHKMYRCLTGPMQKRGGCSSVPSLAVRRAVLVYCRKNGGIHFISYIVTGKMEPRPYYGLK
jgi:hypothetical protein